MTVVNRDRLVKVLALMASPVDGEALAAARKVVELLAAAGLRPEDLINGVFDFIPPVIDLDEFIREQEARERQARPQPRHSFADAPTPHRTSARPRQPSVRDLGPAALRQVLDDLLTGRPFPMREKHQTFVRAIKDRLYREPHVGLGTDEVRRLNMLWRYWLDMQARTAA